ncbi:hypothetical protein LEP1GSC172_2669 [Leptospira noguchii]|uniref:Uncharacterized protein n=1 Tax=Leptospira noguchii TaxID=28182 RepID=M6VJ93_9LEPT|nr:hypothetical protein LEP1GSC172_2669 [Leptospira noguchii]
MYCLSSYNSVFTVKVLEIQMFFSEYYFWPLRMFYLSCVIQSRKYTFR